jgi:hypothetical protein
VRGAIDNLGGVVLQNRLRTTGLVLLYLVFLGGAIGVPIRSLGTAQQALKSQIDARQKLTMLQQEREEFIAAGGPDALDVLANGVVGDLPSNVSRIDLHGAVTLLAQGSGLQLSALSVGEFKHIDAAHLDDAVAKCELSISAIGGADGLSNLVATLSRLGYPTIIEEFRISRPAVSETKFTIHTTLGLFQSIPIPTVIDADSPDQEIPQ